MEMKTYEKSRGKKISLLCETTGNSDLIWGEL